MGLLYLYLLMLDYTVQNTPCFFAHRSSLLVTLDTKDSHKTAYQYKFLYLILRY